VSLNKANNQGTGTNNTRRFGRANWGTLPFHIPRAKENKTVRLNKILPNKKNANLIYFRGLSAHSKHVSLIAHNFEDSRSIQMHSLVQFQSPTPAKVD